MPKKFYFNYCIQRFSDKIDTNVARQRLEEHQIHYSKYGAQKKKLPGESDKWKYFKDYTLCHRVPYTVYGNFESFVVPIAYNTSVNVAHHVPISFFYVIVDWTAKAIAELVLYRGKDIVDTFLGMLMDDVARLNRHFNEPCF